MEIKEIIILLLGFLMFAMGLTLKIKDFSNVLLQPKIIAIGVALQFLLMPLLAFLIANALSLRTEYVIGMVLVGSCAGGFASNLICYLAKGNLALSVTLTTVSTLLSVFLTPVLIKLYLGSVIAIPVVPILFTLLKIILIPIFAGIIFNYFFNLDKFKKILPLLAKFLILLIIALIVFLNRAHLSGITMNVLIAVFLHNILGFIIAYLAIAMFTKSKANRRAVAIEVAMQNSGLASVLAIKFFAPVVVIPAVIFSIWHNLSGLIIAKLFANK